MGVFVFLELELVSSCSGRPKQPFLMKANKLKDKYQKDVADYKTKSKAGGVSMGMGMPMANCMPPKPMMKSNMDDEEDDEEDEEEEEDDDEYDDDE